MLNQIPLIEDIAEVKINASTFNEALKNGNEELIDLLTAFKIWYFFEDLNMFGPSKFIGYKKMNSDKYLEHHTESMDGGVTERALREHFSEVKKNTEEWERLFQELTELLGLYNKKPRKNVVIKK